MSTADEVRTAEREVLASRLAHAKRVLTGVMDDLAKVREEGTLEGDEDGLLLSAVNHAGAAARLVDHVELQARS